MKNILDSGNDYYMIGCKNMILREMSKEEGWVYVIIKRFFVLFFI